MPRETVETFLIYIERDMKDLKKNKSNVIFHKGKCSGSLGVRGRQNISSFMVRESKLMKHVYQLHFHWLLLIDPTS